MAWIVACLALVLILLALVRVVRRAPVQVNLMHAVCVDEKGDVTSSEWVKIPPPDRYETDGPSHVKDYIPAMIRSQADFCHLHVFTFDGRRGFGLQKRRDEPIHLAMTFEWRKHPEREQRARDFFQSLSIKPTTHYLAGNGGVPDATRVLDWPIGEEPAFVIDICERAMRELCAIKDEEGLGIRFDEAESRDKAPV